MLAVLAALSLVTAGTAQTTDQHAGSADSHAAPLSCSAPILSSDSDSIITPDDVLDIYVMDVPELSRQYRVAPSGTVALPLLSDPVTQRDGHSGILGDSGKKSP